jgi:hypothetical protein
MKRKASYIKIKIIYHNNRKEINYKRKRNNKEIN